MTTAVPIPLRRALLALSLLATAAAGPVHGDDWRLGDADQPWRPHPVSALLDAGTDYRPDYIWGGSFAVEVVVDDDGDERIDEDPVDLVDDDGDALYNEDGADGVDNDHDGLLDEDGPDPQFDNDGDGLLNEDGMRTGGVIFDPTLRAVYEVEPFYRHPDAASAAADPTGPGWGWGDDDKDVSCNEDPVDGTDNDGDGLVDEDPAALPTPLPASTSLPTFAYDGAGLTDGERRSLAFTWDTERSAYVAGAPDGSQVTASASRRRLAPRDWVRPIRLDRYRNLVALTADRFLSGVFGSVDPMTGSYWGAIASHASGVPHGSTSGYAQVADGNIFSARSTAQASYSNGFGVHFLGLFILDRIRLRARPDFPDRSPWSFDIFYAGDREIHFVSGLSDNAELIRRMVVSDPIIPRQIDQHRPVIKDFRFEEGGKLGAPRRARILNFWANTTEGETWELAELEAYGHGYAQDATYVTEVIDVGGSRPRFRRYFDEADPANPHRPVVFESFRTLDDNDDGRVQPAELASTKAAVQFDPEAAGRPAVWGRVRWHGQVDGADGDVLIRVRSGTSPDTRVYTRKVGRGAVSPYIDRSLVADWPTPGDRIGANVFVELSALERTLVRDLRPNALGSQDGMAGGWTPWSAPFSFADGAVERDGAGGVPLPLPPLHRYIQFRFDFEAGDSSGVMLDYVEFEYSEPVVSRSVLAEIHPDSAPRLGTPASFEYVLKPEMAAGDAGFNRVDIVVPSTEARLDCLMVDDLRWEPVTPPAGQAASGVWLDTLSGVTAGHFASAVYFDSTDGTSKLAIKTARLTAADFPPGQDREIDIALTSPVYRLLTRFHSWVWYDGADLSRQPTQPGNASDRLPADGVQVTVAAAQTMNLWGVTPNPFTPNGDGANDAAVFGFDLYLLTAEADIEVSIHRLDGSVVRQVSATGSAGVHTLVWDGRDEGGDLVPAGIYLYRLFVDSDTEARKERVGSIAVAY